MFGLVCISGFNVNVMNMTLTTSQVRSCFSAPFKLFLAQKG
uniref:Uncharacterized protein n=1 Tax=Rhizophora mucronata TaxID=61149 RepID=A0A2P2PSS8_RHIMU